MQFWLLACFIVLPALSFRTGHVQSALFFLLGLCVSGIPFWHEASGQFLQRRLFDKRYDFYSTLDHLVLNVSVTTCWLNLGDWTRTTDFSAACEALALRLAKAAHLEPKLRILDAGCGTGQSLRLWHDQYQPAKLVGVTLSPQHAQYALLHLPAEIPVHATDVVRWSAEEVANGTTFDRILALDSAYHFKTREVFLQCAFDLLAPGGRVGLADIVISPSISARDKLLLRLFLPLAGVPWRNMITELQYMAQLEAIGYSHILADDATSAVFPGAATFLSQRAHEPAIAAVTRASTWMGYRAFARVLKWFARGNVVRYVIISAQKPDNKT